MTPKTYSIEFLTPCFCAGAEQTRAELRPSAIRGQLRWWFRALGGSRTEEAASFGSVHFPSLTASVMSVRVVVQPSGGQLDWHSPDRIPSQGTQQPKTYLLGFFCGRTHRLQPGGAIPPGSRARVQIVFRRPPTVRVEQALRVFFSVGALGFRTTRAAGAFTSAEHPLSAADWNSLAAELRDSGLSIGLLPQDFADWSQLLHHAGTLLKHKLRSQDGLGISAGQNGGKANALGSAEPRQTSALHFRPVRIDGRLRLALIEAPHARVLGDDAKAAHRNRGPIVRLAGLGQ
jgi:hypothetical protein